MAQSDPVRVLSRRTYERLMTGLRHLEPSIIGRGFGEQGEENRDQENVTIRVTGPPILMEPTEQKDAIGREDRFIYPCSFVWRDLAAIGTEFEWVEFKEKCWSYDPNEVELGLGCIYPGRIVNFYQQGGLVESQAYSEEGDGTCTSTTTATTSSTQPCEGSCDWELIASIVPGGGSGPLAWFQVASTCTEGCDCPPPDFCPPDYGCGTTRTYCLRDFEPSDDPVYCTTSHTSTTSETTTSTPDPIVCGEGCWWKYVPDLPNPYIKLSGNCNPNAGRWRTGNMTCFCGDCLAPPPISCIEQFTPCEIICIPDPPLPFCGGNCLWVWPDLPDENWILKESDCFGGLADCHCAPPSVAGNACNEKAYTPCFVSGGTSVTGPSTTSSESLPGICDGVCILRWDSISEAWSAIYVCPGCSCTIPDFDGDDDCFVTQSPCIPIPDTTTSTTSATTTTTVCSESSCFFHCSDASIYDLFVDSCNGLFCHCPADPADYLGEPCDNPGLVTSFVCDVGSTSTTTTSTTTATTTTPTTTTTTTTSTTTTTTTTTHEHVACEDQFCSWLCFNEAEGGPRYVILVDCPTDQGNPCLCPQPDIGNICGFGYDQLIYGIPCNGISPDILPPESCDCGWDGSDCPEGKFCVDDPDNPGSCLCVPGDQTTTSTTTTTTTTTLVPCQDCPCNGVTSDCWEIDFGNQGGLCDITVCSDTFGVHHLDSYDGNCTWTQDETIFCESMGRNVAWTLMLICREGEDGNMVMEWRIEFDSSPTPSYLCAFEEFDCELGGIFNRTNDYLDSSDCYQPTITVVSCGISPTTRTTSTTTATTTTVSFDFTHSGNIIWIANVM